MQLTNEQEEAVRGWAEAGEDLGEIQRRLAEEFDVNITYMETRFLVSDLQVSLKDKEREDLDKLNQPGSGADEDDLDYYEDDDDAFGDEATGAGVSVSLDQIAKPNTLLSGKVTFSDGKSAEWYIDVNQQLGMIPPSPDYKPSTSDLMEFQQELQRVVQRGF